MMLDERLSLSSEMIEDARVFVVSESTSELFSFVVASLVVVALKELLFDSLTVSSTTFPQLLGREINVMIIRKYKIRY